jgi:hypothetical protein
MNTASALGAALGYLELGEADSSKKYFDSAIAQSKVEYLKYPTLRDIYIYIYLEILLMAEKPQRSPRPDQKRRSENI